MADPPHDSEDTQAPARPEPAQDELRTRAQFGLPGRPMLSTSPIRVGFLAAVGVGLAYILYQAIVGAWSVLILIVIGTFLAIGLNPLVSRLERAGLRRGPAVSVVFVGALVFLGAFAYAVVPPIANQVGDFVQQAPSYLKQMRSNETIGRLDDRFHIISRLEMVTADGGTSSAVAHGVFGVGKAVASGLFNTVTVLILTLYFLSSFNQIKRTFYGFVPASRRERASLLGDEILGRVGGYLGGAFVIALIAGTTSLIWLSILGVRYPLALALIVTLTDIVPLVGATIGAVIATSAAFFVSLPVGIATGIFYLVYQQVENYLVYPRVMKRAADVHPAAAIVAVLIGGSLLGVVGALVAIPITAGITLILAEVIRPRLDAR